MAPPSAARVDLPVYRYAFEQPPSRSLPSMAQSTLAAVVATPVGAIAAACPTVAPAGGGDGGTLTRAALVSLPSPLPSPLHPSFPLQSSFFSDRHFQMASIDLTSAAIDLT